MATTDQYSSLLRTEASTSHTPRLPCARRVGIQRRLASNDFRSDECHDYLLGYVVVCCQYTRWFSRRESGDMSVSSGNR